MPVKVRQLRRMLVNKLEAEEKTGTHLKYHVYDQDGKMVCCTIISHGVKEYSDSLIKRVYQQMNIDRKMFDGLIDCRVSREDYIRSVRNQRWRHRR